MCVACKLCTVSLSHLDAYLYAFQLSSVCLPVSTQCPATRLSTCLSVSLFLCNLPLSTAFIRP